jgi:hypothetical protein
METPDFPPNSEVSKQARQEKDISQVTSKKVVRKKKSLRTKFKELFIAGDAKSALRYVVLDVLLPAAKDMVVEAGAQGIEKLIYGDARRYRGSTPPQSGPTGYVQYNRYSGIMGGSRLTPSQRVMSRQARARHDFDEIILESRDEANEVIDQLFDVVSRYDTATVADLYELVGLASNHTDHKWGWTDLRGAGVSRSRDGYLLDLPDPHPIGGDH